MSPRGRPRPESGEQVRTAEIVAALCLATDLGMGFPFEHGLQSTLIAIRLADGSARRATASPDLLRLPALPRRLHDGCARHRRGLRRVADHPLQPSHVRVGREVFTGCSARCPRPPSGAGAHASRPPAGCRGWRASTSHLTALCEVAEMLADRLGLPPSMRGSPRYLTERWDGKGPLRRAEGEDIPLPMRIVHVARDAAFQRRSAARSTPRASSASAPGTRSTRSSCLSGRRRCGDPRARPACVGLGRDARPRAGPTARARGRGDRARACGDGRLRRPDLAVLAGHSAGVAELAAAAADAAGSTRWMSPTVRRAALVHDLGRVGDRRADLAEARATDRRRVGAGASAPVPHRTRPVALPVPVRARAGRRRTPRAARRFRLSPRRPAPSSPLSARLLAAADAYHAMTEPRPHRAPPSAGAGRGPPRRTTPGPDDSTPTRSLPSSRRPVSPRRGSSGRRV